MRQLIGSESRSLHDGLDGHTHLLHLGSHLLEAFCSAFFVTFRKAQCMTFEAAFDAPYCIIGFRRIFLGGEHQVAVDSIAYREVVRILCRTEMVGLVLIGNDAVEAIGYLCGNPT